MKSKVEGQELIDFLIMFVIKLISIVLWLGLVVFAVFYVGYRYLKEFVRGERKKCQLKI